MSHARGFTLVEMLVSISVGGVLMGLALGLVHRTMRSESAARSHAQIERTAARLSRQFRHDIHQAHTISLDPPLVESPRQLQLQLPDQRSITYRQVKDGLLREQQLPNNQTRRELYSFPEDHTIGFSELQRPPRAVLKLERDTQLVGIRPQQKLHVEAVIGQFLRLSHFQEASQ